MRPLKIGIYEDLERLGMPKNLLKSFVRWYVGRKDYRATLKAGAARFDLDGNQVGEVTTEQAAHALKQTLPIDRPLTEKNTVLGRLDITIKFSELPRPSRIQAGYRFAVVCDGRLIRPFHIIGTISYAKGCPV